MGFRLVDGDYVEISPLPNGGIPSEALGLEFHLLDDTFGIYDPKTQKWLKTAAEDAEERAEDAEERAEDARDTRQSGNRCSTRSRNRSCPAPSGN